MFSCSYIQHQVWADRLFQRDGTQYVSTENMTTELLQSLLQLHSSSSPSGVADSTGSIEILVERTETEEHVDISSLSNYVVGHSGDIFSKGLYWSMDKALDGVVSYPL